MTRPRRATHIHPVEAVVLALGASLGVLFLLVLAWASSMSLHQKLVDDVYPVQLSYDGGRIPAPTSGTAHVSQVYAGTVSAQLSHLTSGLTTLVVLQNVLGFLLYALIIGAGIHLCVRVLRGRPFARSMTIALWITAATLAILGTTLEVLSNVIANAESFEALGPHPAAPFAPTNGFNFTGGYLLGGAAVAAVAVAFRAGARMKRDTDGLV